MPSRALLLCAIFSISVLGQPLRGAWRSGSKNNEDKLVAKIEREQNPGKKARLQMRLAQVKLQRATDAYKAGQYDRGWALLGEYRQAIDVSWKTLTDAPGGPSKHMDAYKDLEIHLREDGRQLEELHREVSYPQDQAIKEIAQENGRIHKQVMDVLFPAGIPAPKSKKPRQRGGLAAVCSAVQA